MAYIETRSNGFLVVWRDAETNKKRSRFFRWGYQVTNFEEDGPDTLTVGKDDARRAAEALAAEMKSRERAYTKPLELARKRLLHDDPTYRPIFGPNEFIGEGEEGQRFENYVASLVDGGAITDSAKHTYRHTLDNHIRGTALGRKNVRFIDPDDIETFWNELKVGEGAKRNIAQVLRKGFTRALRRGLIEVNPMTRSDIEVPSKTLRVRGTIQVLQEDELRALAEAAVSRRDRLIVRVMGYGGLRAGECGGLT